jgi:hypothetical protein
MVNVSIDGYKIIKKKSINIGVAVALPDGNLIVPVIHNADQLSLMGLAKKVNDYAIRATAKQVEARRIIGGHLYHHQHWHFWEYCRNTDNTATAGSDYGIRPGKKESLL